MDWTQTNEYREVQALIARLRQPRWRRLARALGAAVVVIALLWSR